VLFLLYLGFEGFQSFAPEPVEIGPKRGKPARVQSVIPSCSSCFVADKLRVLQHSQMLRYCGPRDRQTFGEFANWQRSAAQALEEGSSRHVAEGIELLLMVSFHLR